MSSLLMRAPSLLKPAVFAFILLQAPHLAAQPAAATVQSYLRLPLAFEREGSGAEERFLAQGQSYAVGLERGKATIGIASTHEGPAHILSLEFTGSRAARAEPQNQLPGKVNYIHGNDPRKWRIGLPIWERVTYPEIYPGVDVAYYGNQRQLEFDFVLKPGADPESIRMRVAGASRLALDSAGALRIDIGGAGDLRIELPTLYQEIGGKRRNVPGRYVIQGGDEVAFRVGPYDRTQPLVIDPTIVYSTLFGGGLSGSDAFGIGVDAEGNVLIAGSTTALDFPAVNATQNALAAGSQDGFIAKIDKTGDALIYSTFFGGSSNDIFYALAVDSNGSAWVTGYTNSSDFPLLNAAQSLFGGFQCAIVVKLDENGALQFSTYLGGNVSTYGYDIAVDSAGNGYVTGTASGSFPTTPGTVQPPTGGGKAFVTKYGPAGAIVYSTLLGGDGVDGGFAIAVDLAGNAYVTGISHSTTFAGAPPGGAQTVNNGNGDSFVAKLNPDATGLLYFTFLGGSASDEGNAITVDASGNAYVAGNTSSTGLATPGAVQMVLAGATNGFAAKLNAAGSAFQYVTYLGGGREDVPVSMALDPSGNVYLTGYTDSANFPTVSPLQATIPGNGTSLFSSADSGATWTAFDSNIPSAVLALSVNPANSSTVVLTEAGIFRTANGGMSWNQQFAVSFNQSAFVSRSPVSPATIYAADCCGTIYRSSDDGVTWSLVGFVSSGGGAILADPLTANTLYAVGTGAQYVSKSTDGGATWNWAQTGLPALVETMVATSDGALYAAVYGNNYGIYKSTDQGASWSAANTGLPSGVAVQSAHSLTASGTTVYFADNSSTDAGTIYKTTNGGSSWAATQGYVGAYGIVASAEDPSILYAFTGQSALTYYGTLQKSTDGGATWSVADELPSGVNYNNSQLIVDPGNTAHLFLTAPVNYKGFVSKLNSTGSGLIWSTYLGSSSSTYAEAVATDGKGNVFVTGDTGGPDFPVTSSALPSGGMSSSDNVFITKISDATAVCSVIISPASITTPPSGEALTFSVVAPGGCPWTASTNESWAPVVAGSSGTGVGSVTVLLPVNTDSVDPERTAVLTVGNQNVTIVQAGGGCAYAMDKSSYAAPSSGGVISAVLTATAGCPWAVTNNYPAAVTITSGVSGTGSSTITLDLTPNLTAIERDFNLSVGTTQIQIAQARFAYSPALQLMPLAPCRVMDTRNPASPLGGPFLSAGATRAIPIPASACGVPSNAAAYALNITVVPRTGTLGYLTVWPGGQVQPQVSTLNSLDGSVIANAAIVPAGDSGSINAFATDDTDLIVDINGYFVPPAGGALQFYPLTPCRVLDTRNRDGDFGGPSLAGSVARSFQIGSSLCAAISGFAAAYSLNVTVVPHGTLGYLTVWPTGQTQPLVSTLNSLDGTVLANAAIVPAGTGGAVSFFGANDTDLVVDINGYFAPPSIGGLDFHTAAPCRLVDTRNPDGAYGGPVMAAQTTRSFPLGDASCGLPPSAHAYSLNMTVVPQAPTLGYLSTWAAGGTQPVVSTLNALKGQIVANAAIVPAGLSGAIDVFVTDTAQVIIDTDGYFGQ